MNTPDDSDEEAFSGYCVNGRPVVIKNTFIELQEPSTRRRTFSHSRCRSFPESLAAPSVSEPDLDIASLEPSRAEQAREIQEYILPETVPEEKMREIETQTTWSDFSALAEINDMACDWQPPPKIGFCSHEQAGQFGLDDGGSRAEDSQTDLTDMPEQPQLPEDLFSDDGGWHSAAAVAPAEGSVPELKSGRQSNPDAFCFVPDPLGGDHTRSEASTDAESNDFDGGNSHRTTVMIRNLPAAATRGMLEKLLGREGFGGCYDFIYVPSDIASGTSFYYAFINLVSPVEARRFHRHFTGFRRWLQPCEKEALVDWSEALQGIFALAERYRDSPLMHKTVPDGLRPAMYRDGRRLAFPPPTRTLRLPRLRRGAPKLPRECGRFGSDAMGYPLAASTTPEEATSVSVEAVMPLGLCGETMFSNIFCPSPLQLHAYDPTPHGMIGHGVHVDSAAIMTRSCRPR